jgi:sugar lactone lactonase YvrE
MRQGRLLFVGLLGASLAFGVARLEAATPAGAAASCDPDGTLRFVCGPVNAEDILRLGDTRWLVASGLDGPLNGGAPARGHLYLIDHQTKRFVDWFPGDNPAFRHDRTMFPGCPGPLDTASFSAHGLAVREHVPGRRYRIYVTSHGAREAIEVFEAEFQVRAGRVPGPEVAISWVGCVVLPDNVSANGVATLPDGGFITTQFMDRSLPLTEAFGQIRRGQVNGRLYEWHPDGKLEPIAGSEMSGPNGIAVSPDGNTIYVAAFGTRELVRFQRGAGGLRRHAVSLPITPDNVHWTADGKLIVAGSNYTAPAAAGAPPPAGSGWSVLEVEPRTLAARRIAGAGQAARMQGISAAILVGDTVWVGTYSGNRVGYLPAE